MKDITVLETVRTGQLGIAGRRGFTEFCIPGTEKTYSVLIYDTDGGLAGPYHLDEGTEFIRDQQAENG